MATLNVSDKQKARVVTIQQVINKQLGTDQSQAQIVDMGMALLEEKYGVNAN